MCVFDWIAHVVDGWCTESENSSCLESIMVVSVSVVGPRNHVADWELPTIRTEDCTARHSARGEIRIKSRVSTEGPSLSHHCKARKP